jgi:putative hydrolase of the HAD superfamily
MVTTVVFDLDDTLYDEVDYCKSGFGAVAAVISGHPNFPDRHKLYDAFWQQFSAGNHTTTFNDALKELNISYDDQLIRKMVTIYRRHHPTISLPAETKNVLDLLRKKYTLALLTDGFLPAQELKVRALGLEEYFECIVYTEQLGREFWKPSPAGFEKITRSLRQNPENCVYVADNEQKDFIGPNKLGFHTVELIRPNRIHTQPAAKPEAKAGHVIHSLRQLPVLLAKF